jgi:hypothetical protein
VIEVSRLSSGVIELVWNAMTPKAENVQVAVAESPLGGVEEVRASRTTVLA